MPILNNNQEDNNPSAPNLNSDAIKPPRMVRKTAKPLVEGINAPASKPPVEPFSPPVLEPESPQQPVSSPVIAPKVSLSNLEKELLSSTPAASPAAPPAEIKSSFVPQLQKIVLPEQKQSYLRRIIWSALISLLAVCVVLAILLWYNNRSTGQQVGMFNLFPKNAAITVKTEQQSNNVPVSAPAQQPVAAAPIAQPATSTQPAAASATPPSAPSPTVTQVKVTATPTGFLNVRSTYSTSGKLLGKINPGEVYTYTETKSGWYHIVLSDGSTGWVTGQYVQVVK